MKKFSIPLKWLHALPGLEVSRLIKSGKEADVWLLSQNNNLFAAKVYRNDRKRSRDNYTEGNYFKEASLRKAVALKTKRGKEIEQELWVKREYYLLRKLYELGAAVPEVFAYSHNAILMQYLGDKQQNAPRLIDCSLALNEAVKVHKIITDNMQLFLDNGIVHGDLSAYNILWWQNQPWIIDFPQAIDIRHNPHWREFYERDIANIAKYFS